jgi:DNA-binding transcriptional MerR regulator
MCADCSIGDLARETGCKVQTIRYYEQIGLTPHPARSSGNQRRYDRRHVKRLAFIRHSRQLQAVEQRIVRLQALKIELEGMIDQCRGGQICDCRIIEALGDHTQCDTAIH